jgi:hypothetical protein
MPQAIWVASLFGATVPMPPAIDQILVELVFALLGLGTLRTVEKIKGVARIT